MIFNLFLTFARIGAFTFGGGYSMIPLFNREIIDRYGWLTSAEFLDIIATAEMTPGPISINTATFVGYKLAGFWGSVAATLGIVLPAFIAISLLTVVLEKIHDLPAAQNGIKGMRPAVTAMIITAALSLAPKSILRPLDLIIFCATILLSWRELLNPIIVLFASGLISLLYGLF
jgi:chromate transporter